MADKVTIMYIEYLNHKKIEISILYATWKSNRLCKKYT